MCRVSFHKSMVYNFMLSAAGPFWPSLFSGLFSGLDNWTGLLDWTTGLDYWTHGNCLWRRKEQDYTEIHTAIQESRVIFHRSQHVVLNSVRSWCKCAIKNWSHNPGNEAKYSLVPRLPRSGTRTLKLCRRSLVPRPSTTLSARWKAW